MMAYFTDIYASLGLDELTQYRNPQSPVCDNTANPSQIHLQFKSKKNRYMYKKIECNKNVIHSYTSICFENYEEFFIWVISYGQ